VNRTSLVDAPNIFPPSSHYDVGTSVGVQITDSKLVAK
jgi:hypothetical protein